MNKFKMTLLFSSFTIALFSCTKNYSCRCVKDGDTTVYQMESRTKVRASKECNEQAYDLMLDSNGQPGSCKFIQPE